MKELWYSVISGNFLFKIGRILLLISVYSKQYVVYVAMLAILFAIMPMMVFFRKYIM